MFEKHRWKSDILSKDAGENVTPPQLFFKHFASKSQLPGLSISGKLVENGLKYLNFIKFYCTNQL